MTGGADNGLVGTGATSTITINTGGTLTSVAGATTTNHIKTFYMYGGTLAFAGTVTADALTYGSYNLDQGVVAGGATATATSVISALGVALTQTGGTTFNVSPAATQLIAGIDLDVTGSFVVPTGVTNTAFIKTGTGVMRLDGTNTFTAATTISAGTLIIGNGGTTGSLASTSIAVNGTLAFNLSSATTFALSSGISGTGTLTQMGPGVLTVPGPNTFASTSGNVSVLAGTLRLQANSVGSNAAVAVSDGAIFSTYGVTPTSSTLSISTLALGNTTGATLGFELNGVPTTAALTVTTLNGLTMNGTTIINVSNSQGTPAGEIPLIAYSGTPITSGFTIGSLPTSRTIASLDYSTAGLIQLNVISSAIKWSGAVNSTWDVGTAINTGGTFNWTSKGNATNFFTGDSVVFDDTASTGGGTGPVTVSLGVSVTPGTVRFANTTRAYTLSGTGSITGGRP